MDEKEASSQPARFPLTPRQRRLRVAAVIILALVLLMIVVGRTHPFFRSPGSASVLEQVRREILAQRAPGAARRPPSPLRRAVYARLLMIYFYWITCVLLTTSLFIIAWLDIREVRRQMLLARRDMWKDIVEESRRHRERDGPGKE